MQPRPEDHLNPAQTAEEAARRMLDSKKLSNKINYDVLADLFNTDTIHQECVLSCCVPLCLGFGYLNKVPPVIATLRRHIS